MKIKWRHFIFVILSLNLSCAHKTTSNGRLQIGEVREKIKSQWEKLGFKYVAEDDTNFEFQPNLQTSSLQKITYKILEFNTSEAATQHLMNRRLTVQRLYQLSSEPYFGTPDESNCRENISVEEPVEQSSREVKASLRLLANFKYVLGDCLIQNNHFRVYMALQVRDAIFIEAKAYVPILEKTPLWPFVGF